MLINLENSLSNLHLSKALLGGDKIENMFSRILTVKNIILII